MSCFQWQVQKSREGVRNKDAYRFKKKEEEKAGEEGGTMATSPSTYPGRPPAARTLLTHLGTSWCRAAQEGEQAQRAH